MVTVMYKTLFIFFLEWKNKYYVCYCHMKVEDGYRKLSETSPHACCLNIGILVSFLLLFITPIHSILLPQPMVGKCNLNLLLAKAI
jgi:hypothetical protein